MTPPSIFVTDDEPARVEYVKELLTDAGYARVVGHVGASAFHRIRDQQPDLVLLDINLSNPARGWSTLDALRFHPKTRHISVILCSTDMRLLGEKADLLRTRTAILVRSEELNNGKGTIERAPRSAASLD
jgi:CheY-like chemotaxis protein